MTDKRTIAGAYAKIEEPDAPDFRNEALQALAASDITVLRCVEVGAALPLDWIAYREALREVVRTGEGPLPTRPDWP